MQNFKGHSSLQAPPMVGPPFPYSQTTTIRIPWSMGMAYGNSCEGGSHVIFRGIESAWPDLSPWICWGFRQKSCTPCDPGRSMVRVLTFQIHYWAGSIVSKFFSRGEDLQILVVSGFASFIFVGYQERWVDMPPDNRPAKFRLWQQNSLGTLRTRRQRQLEDVIQQ